MWADDSIFTGGYRMNVTILNPVINFDGGTILLIGIFFIVVIWISRNK
ncbi:hypothetical protein [Fusobacterium mortiferum]|nr:hypothetical protein [Fusobacterium mortiferum]